MEGRQDQDRNYNGRADIAILSSSGPAFIYPSIVVSVLVLPTFNGVSDVNFPKGMTVSRKSLLI